MKRLLAFCCILPLAFATGVFAIVPEGEEDEAVVELELEGVVVEGALDLRELQLFQEKALTQFIEQLQLRDDSLRAAELQKAHQNSITTMLDLTKYVPIPLGNSGRPVDTYFLENHMRPDLNPPEADPLSLRK